MFVFRYKRVYALFMFGDVVRELAPGYVEAPEAGVDTASGWPPVVGSAWPDPTAVWTGGEMGPFEDLTSSAEHRSDAGAVSALSGFPAVR